MALYKGLAFCIKCGNFGSVRLRNLALLCEGTPNKYGRELLEALQHDRLPNNVTCWPEDEPVVTHLAYEEDQARLRRRQAKFDAELVEELEANLEAGIASHRNDLIGPGIVPIANAASSSSNPAGEPLLTSDLSLSPGLSYTGLMRMRCRSNQSHPTSDGTFPYIESRLNTSLPLRGVPFSSLCLHML